MRPQIFVGSSSESHHVALAVQEQLDDDADVTIWTQRVFEPFRSTFELLSAAIAASDAGVFILSPDDTVRIRGVELSCPRDNVILELGYALGHLGRSRCFVLVPRGGQALRLASDLDGLEPLRYRCDRSDNNLVAALGPACNKIRRAILALGLRRG